MTPGSRMRIVLLGRSVTSSLATGHASIYRALMKGLAASGHHVLFLEHDLHEYAGYRDQRHSRYGRVVLYRNQGDLEARAARDVREADLVIVGSGLVDGAAVAAWVTRIARGFKAFYDLDATRTLRRLEHGDTEVLTPELLQRFDLYLSSIGGSVLERMERRFGARRVAALYPSVDVDAIGPVQEPVSWDLGYLGSASDREEKLGHLLLDPARRWPAGGFVIAGAGDGTVSEWPRNVERLGHVATADHSLYYSRQRYALNLTRPDETENGYAPGTRLFEAAVCGTPVITDWWHGLDSIFEPGAEILVASGPIDVIALLRDMSEADRITIGDAARRRVIKDHTAERRARQLLECMSPTRVLDTLGAASASAAGVS